MKRNSKVSNALLSIGFSLASLAGTTMIANAIQAEYLLLNNTFRVDGNLLRSRVEPLPNSNRTPLQTSNRTPLPNSNVTPLPNPIYTSLPNSNVTQFCLQASSNVSWWKGLKIFDGQGKLINLIVTQENSRLSCTPEIPNSRLAGGKIEFWKAKTFGAHTYMDSAKINAHEVKDKKITITWMDE